MPAASVYLLENLHFLQFFVADSVPEVLSLPSHNSPKAPANAGAFLVTRGFAGRLSEWVGLEILCVSAVHRAAAVPYQSTMFQSNPVK